MQGIKFDHVACGVREVSAVSGFLEQVLGASPHIGGPGHGFSGAQWIFANDAVLEIIEPEGAPDGFLHRFIDAGGPRLHHLTFKVRDIHEAVARAREFDYDVVGLSDANPGWKEAFLHPKQALGIVVQLAESYPDLDETAWGPMSDDAAGKKSRPAPAALLGLLMRVPDLGAAARQWGELLGADCVRDQGRLSFAWPGSPMSVVVVEDTAAEPGPLGLRVHASRPLELSNSPQPQLGTSFIVV